MRKKGKLRLLAIVACQMIVGFAIAEVAGRFLFADLASDEAYLDRAYALVLNSETVAKDGTPGDPTASFRPSPFSDASMCTSEFCYTSKSNSLGFRSKELQARTPDEYRVLLIGDSMFWGVGLRDEETIASIIERNAGPGVSAYNYAVPGLNSVHEHLIARSYASEVEPDHIILGFFVANDVVPNFISYLDESGQFAINGNAESSIKRHIKSELGLPFYSVLFRKLSLYGYLSRVRYSIALRPEILRSTFETIDKISRLAAERGSAFSVVVMYPRDSIAGVGGWFSNSESVGNAVASYCRDRSISVFDTIDVMSGEQDVQRYYYPTDGHYRPEGADVVGKGIVERLIQPRRPGKD